MRTKTTYAKYIHQFLAIKRSMGLKMKTGENTLLQFNRYAITMGQLPGITKDFMDAWCEKRSNETNSTRYNRIVYLRQFAKYLSSIGVISYIPELPKLRSSFTPYIFSREQIEAFFLASDQFKPYRINYNSSWLIMPTLFRTLYGTGLRLGEALALKDKDVNLKDQYIIVRQSKNGAERIVPISGTLAEVFTKYKEHKERSIGNSITSELFFIKKNQTKCDNKSAYDFFRQILWRIGVAHRGRGYGPRLHDLRHTFACHALKVMTDSGLDFYCSLPILSNYLGHQGLAATNKYVRLTAELYPDILKAVNNTCSYVFPEIKNIENETN
jgi:integrase/recombinase XerD